MADRRRKRSLKSAFVATVASGAALFAGAGCENQTVVSNPPATGCPSAMPAAGGSCDSQGQCEFVDQCGFSLTATCGPDGVWNQTAVSSCNPPPPDPPDPPPPLPESCPLTVPTPGSACFDATLYCIYDDGSACGGPEAQCQEDGIWDVYETSCNPPPPECPAELPAAGAICEPQVGTWGEYPWGCQFAVTTACGDTLASAGCESDAQGTMVWAIDLVDPCVSDAQGCAAYDDPSVCSAESACRWLVPGCADGLGAPAAVAGCYPTEDCSVAGCGSWGSCQSMVNDPCAGSNCNACGELVNACVPLASGGT